VLLSRLERAAEIQLAAQAGSAVQYPSQEAIDRTIEFGRKRYTETKQSPAASLEWAAFRRKIDREDPGYAV
jgi:hypothetical protein